MQLQYRPLDSALWQTALNYVGLAAAKAVCTSATVVTPADASQASSVLLGFYYHGMPRPDEKLLNNINTGFSCLFIAEVTCKFVALGPATWACDWFNLFEYRHAASNAGLFYWRARC